MSRAYLSFISAKRSRCRGPVVASPSGRRLLVGSTFDSKRSEALLLEMATGAELAAYHGHENNVGAVAFSPVGRWMITGSLDSTARVWEAETARPLQVLAGHEGAVSSVAFSPDGHRALTGSADGTARLWDVETGAPVAVFAAGAPVLDIAVSPDGKRAIAGTIDSTAVVWDLRTGERIATLREHTGQVVAVGFSPSGDPR